MFTAKQIRQKFLDYFEKQKHSLVKSASLIPQNDPTLYFTNAGMVQFKNYFTGEEESAFNRAVSCQKCMRVSGKHNDLENVGRTARHHTFFEMLGNFSFGDYFKSDAIEFAWDFLTRELKLDKNKLWITVFTDDDEAADIWHKEQKVPVNKIVRMGEKDNFWSMGDTGPCGPCSEIHFEQDIACTLNNPKCEFGKCDCDRFIEIWNLVFMQYERQADGKLKDLPKPSIDTGMGLERLVAILQGKTNNYDSDIFAPIFKKIEKIVGQKYGADAEATTSMRVLADHIRATVFLISDGVLPSNEGRGYVLRRIMRRAIRHGKILGQTGPFFFKLVPSLLEEMGEAYPDLTTNQKTITKVIEAEEKRFFETLEKGLKLLSEEITIQQKQKSQVLPGEIAFKLYDTYGFPLDLTELICEENSLTVDQKGFDQFMQEQKERARAGWKGSGEGKVQKVYLDLAQNLSTQFLGYETLEATATVEALLQNDQVVDEVTQGKFEVIFDQTPFYAEGGGQAGDKGVLSQGDLLANVIDVQKPVEGLFVHQAELQKGSLKKGQKVQLKVFREVRKPTMCNHTATHILHAALRDILGSHVRQAGSLVNDKILRFDFSHFEAISPQDLLKIEDAVNQVVLSDIPVSKEEMSYDDAMNKGALAFFGDKYGDRVRVVSVGDYSIEFCGGTHLDHSSEIGFFKILSEGSIAAGVRRIEATTGLNAIKIAQQESQLLKDMALSLKTQTQDLPDKVQKLQEQLKSKNKEIEKLKSQALRGGAVDFLANAFEVNGVKAVFYNAEVDNPGQLREVSDALVEKLKSGIGVVGAIVNDKPNIVVSVTSDLVKKYNANQILQKLLPFINGRGGGKADRAQAGGTNPAGLSKIQDELKKIL